MLRIPNLTTEDYFKLEDFQNDFNYLNQLNLDIASSIKNINDWKDITSSSISNLEKNHTADINSIRNTASLNYTNLYNLLASISESAQRYGINGNELADDTDKIQEFIARRGNLYFPKGIYNLSKMIDIYSNTTITLHPEAKFVRKHAGSMFQTATTTETTDYNGEKNIRINGGIYNHSGNTNPSNILTLFHAQDVIINDVVFLDTVGAHCLDVVGSKDIKVFNCKFKGYVATVADTNKEAIQIDACGCNSYPIYADTSVAAYDGTPTRDVIIENCVFCKSDINPPYPTAIGQHGQVKLKGSRYRNIKILNNLMIGDPTYLYSYGIRAISWEDALIDGNVIENYRVSICTDLYSSVIDPHGEPLKGETNHVTASDEDIYYIACRNITITNNILRAAVSTHPMAGIWFNIAGTTIASSMANSPKHRGAIITGNTIYMPSPTVKSYGIDMDTTEDAIISNNTFINNAKADSIGIGCEDYCKNIIIGDNTYKGITNDNEVYVKDNTEGVKNKGKTVLWTGKVYGENETINLSKNMSDFDAIFVEFDFFGTQVSQMDFSTATLQSFREFNLADAATSYSINYYEARLKRLTDKSITHVGSKMVLSSNNSISLNDANYYVKSVYGINY